MRGTGTGTTQGHQHPTLMSSTPHTASTPAPPSHSQPQPTHQQCIPLTGFEPVRWLTTLWQTIGWHCQGRLGSSGAVAASPQGLRSYSGGPGCRTAVARTDSDAQALAPKTMGSGRPATAPAVPRPIPQPGTRQAQPHGLPRSYGIGRFWRLVGMGASRSRCVWGLGRGYRAAGDGEHTAPAKHPARGSKQREQGHTTCTGTAAPELIPQPSTQQVQVACHSQVLRRPPARRPVASGQGGLLPGKALQVVSRRLHWCCTARSLLCCRLLQLELLRRGCCCQHLGCHAGLGAWLLEGRLLHLAHDVGGAPCMAAAGGAVAGGRCWCCCCGGCLGATGP